MVLMAQHWIDGDAVGEPSAESLDPASGALVGRFADGGEGEAENAIAAARRAFDRGEWAASPRLRQSVLLAWAAGVKACQAELVELLTRDNGKAFAQSQGEIAASVSEILYYAGLARHVPGHVLEPEPGVLSTMLREPAGVAGIIVPWNAPAVLLAPDVPGGDLAAGAFLTPALVQHQDPSASFVQEEIFGPFLVLESFEAEAEAVARANDTVFGLSASVWTNDGARALRIARALRNGTVWINDHNRLLAEAETGGYRQSGLGRLHGYDALADFTELKHIYQAPGVVGAVV